MTEIQGDLSLAAKELKEHGLICILLKSEVTDSTSTTSRHGFQDELVVSTSHCELPVLLGKLIIMWKNGGYRIEKGSEEM